MKRITNHEWDITPASHYKVDNSTRYIYNIFLPGMKRATRITIDESIHSRHFMNDALWALHRDFRWEYLQKGL